MMIRTALVLCLVAGPTYSGTLKQVRDYPVGGCVYIPKDMACLSACAYGSDKANFVILEGVRGYHLPYDPTTKEVTGDIIVWAITHQQTYGGPKVSELWSNTTTSAFWVEGDILEWPEDFEGMSVTSNPFDLIRCDGEDQ